MIELVFSTKQMATIKTTTRKTSNEDLEIWHLHCVKGVGIQSYSGPYFPAFGWFMITLRKKCPYLEFFWSVFSHIWTEYGEILRIQSKYGKI